MIRYAFFLILFAILSNTEAIAQDKHEQQIDSLFAQIEASQPGAVVSVIRQNQVIYLKAFGAANLEHQIPNTTATLFDIGALTMHVTAASIAVLEEQNKLSLDDPIQKYLPELPKYDKGSVTIKHLLNHTSGIRDYLVALDMQGKDWDLKYTKEDAMTFLAKQSAIGFVPGQEFEYSNSNYLLLSQIVSQVSNQRLGDFAKQHLFDPAQMSVTRYYEKPNAVLKNRATAYSKADSITPFTREHFAGFAAAGDGRLYTSMDDFIKWQQFIKKKQLKNGTLFQWITERGVQNDGKEMTYARGLEHGFYEGFASAGHNGYWGGFSSFYLQFFEPELSITVFSNNSEVQGPPMVFRIASILLADEEQRPDLPEVVSKSYSIKPKNLKQYSGDFITYKTGYLRKIHVKNDTLRYIVSPGNERALLPIGENEFSLVGMTGYTLSFTTNSGGSKNMALNLDGLLQYNYQEIELSSPSSMQLNQVPGAYYSRELDATYSLSVEKDEVIVSIDGEEFMRYLPKTSSLFTSTSGHHGYLIFDEKYEHFTLNDYSMKHLNFTKKSARTEAVN